MRENWIRVHAAAGESSDEALIAGDPGQDASALGAAGAAGVMGLLGSLPAPASTRVAGQRLADAEFLRHT